jgi:predicted metalloprotease
VYEKVVLHGICEVAEFFKFFGYFGRKVSKQSGNSGSGSVSPFLCLGDHQKVASFSFYGELKSIYYEGIEENAKSLEV